MRQVAEQEPKRPSSINRRVDRDLETICLKCLQKNPAQRYASAEALAEDLERWLRGEPIRARPSQVWEQALKWTKRRPALASLLLLALVAPAIVITVLLVMGARVTRERNKARQQEGKAIAAATRAEAEAEQAAAARAYTRQNLYAADMLLAQHALDDGNLGLARRLVLAWQLANSNPSTLNPQPTCVASSGAISGRSARATNSTRSTAIQTVSAAWAFLTTEPCWPRATTRGWSTARGCSKRADALDPVRENFRRFAGKRRRQCV